MAFITGLLCADVLAQDKRNFGYGVETDFSWAYVWRGLMLDDKPVVETSAWIDGFGLSLTAWGNLIVGATDGQTRMRVSGMSLAYSRDWRKLTIESAVEAYRWPEDLGSGNTIESSLRLSYRSGSFRVSGARLSTRSPKRARTLEKQGWFTRNASPDGRRLHYKEARVGVRRNSTMPTLGSESLRSIS